MDELVGGEGQGLGYGILVEGLHHGAQALVDGVQHHVEAGADKGHAGDGGAGELLQILRVAWQVVAREVGGGLGHGQRDQGIAEPAQGHEGRHADGLHGRPAGGGGAHPQLELVRCDLGGGIQPERLGQHQARTGAPGEHLQAVDLAQEARGCRPQGGDPAPVHPPLRQGRQQVGARPGTHHGHVRPGLDDGQTAQQQLGTDAAGISQADGDARTTTHGDPSEVC